MREILNAMRREAMQTMGERAPTLLGIIRNYDPNNFAVRVELQPEGNLSDWMPILTPWSGNGWGMFCAPSIGDLVEVQFQEADHDSPMCSLRVFNDNNRPLPAPSGEFWLMHKSGAFLKLLNNGKAQLTDGHGATLTLNGDGSITSSATTWNHTGPVNINGNTTVTGNIQASADILDQGGIKGTLQHVRDNYDAHTHGGVQTGGGSTGTPSNTL